MSTQQLVERLAMALGSVREAGLIFGLDLGPGSWKVLFPLLLAAVSPSSGV